MIFYFSGTGNSKWIAEKIGKKIGEEVLDIAKLIKEGLTAYQPKSGETVGLVFPVYAWAAPSVVLTFAKNIKTKEDNYTFAVCSCASEAGFAIEELGKVFKLKSGYSIIMPNNYITGGEADSKEEIERKISSANSRIIGICQHILEKEEMIDSYKGKHAFLKSHIANTFFNAFARSTKSFSVKDNCDGCGECAENCSAGVIELVEGKPKWNGKCNMCYSCINRCPKSAIIYGGKTEGKERYFFEGKYSEND